VCVVASILADSTPGRWLSLDRSTCTGSTHLANGLPVPPEIINYAMARFLVSTPWWVREYVHGRPHNLLGSEHCEYLIGIMEALQDLSCSPDPEYADGLVHENDILGQLAVFLLCHPDLPPQFVCFGG
jgi:hypothetical protein